MPFHHSWCFNIQSAIGDKSPEDFEKYFLDEFNVRVKFLEIVITNGNIERNEEGGRSDLFFYLHDDDVMKFAVERLAMGIRWWEDVVSYNDNAYLYPQEILDKYKVKW